MTGKDRNADGSFKERTGLGNECPEFSLRGNVWHVWNQNRGIEHPAPFPQKLAGDHIATWSNPGDHWQALPEKLRTRIDEFNKQPREARDTALSLMRGRMERDPAVAEKLIGQLGQAKEKIQELSRGRGMSR